MVRLLFVVLLAAVGPLRGQTLPVVEEVDWPMFRDNVEQLLAGLKKLDGPLPSETMKAVAALLAEKAPVDVRKASGAVQRLLDAQCLIGVHINPESRVKAARGARAAELTLDQPTFLLVKVHNEAGVTHPLMVASEQAVAAKPDAGRWVEASIVNDKPFANRLSGERVEYRVLKLTARQAGKREATLSFDVGQGTQDLGFRSETPILFRVRAK